MARERDVRTAARDALLATGVFADVWLTGLPEQYGQAASELTAAAIAPKSGRKKTRGDAGNANIWIEVTSVVIVTLLVRNSDPQLRDEQLELLKDTAEDALDGQSLGGLTIPDLTYLSDWQYEKETPPERRLTAKLTYSYPRFGWTSSDTTP